MPQVNSKKLLNNKLVKLVAQNKIWAFIFVFGLIGIVGVTASFASDPNAILTGAEDVVFEYRNEEHEEGDVEVSADNLVTHDEDTTLVLGNGRYFCSDEDPLNPVGIEEGQLSKAAINKLVADIRATGFQSLQDVYSPSGGVKTHEGESFTLQMAGGPKTVYLQETDAPAALTRVRQIMDNLCNGDLKQYYPEQAEVVTTKITQERIDQLKTEYVTTAIEKQDINELSARTNGIMNDILAKTKAQQPKVSQRKALDRTSARKLLDQLKAKPSKVLTDGTQDVELEVRATLPKYKPAIVVPKKKSVLSRVVGSVFGAPKVEAQTTKTVEFVWFYAADEAIDPNWQSRLNTTASQIKNFYQSRSGKTMNVSTAGNVRGARALSGYGGNIYTMFDVLDGELRPRMVNPNKIIHLVVQNSPDYRAGYCGGGRSWQPNIGNPNDTNNKPRTNLAWGISGNFMNCFKRGSGETYQFATAAHEIGHTMGLGHLTKDRSLMSDNQPAGTCNLLNAGCYIEAGQLDALKRYSPYLGATPTNTTPPPTAPAPTPQPAKTTTIKGTKVSVSGNNYSQDSALSGIHVVYLDGAAINTASMSTGAQIVKQNSNSYEFRDVPRGYHRVGVWYIPSGWEVAGATVCYDGGSCNQQATSANPERRWYYGVPSVVVNSTNSAKVEIRWQFKKTAPPASNQTSGYSKPQVTANITCDGVSGTAYDRNSPSGSVQVHVYFDTGYSSSHPQPNVVTQTWPRSASQYATQADKWGIANRVRGRSITYHVYVIGQDNSGNRDNGDYNYVATKKLNC